MEKAIEHSNMESVYKNFFRTPPLWAGKFFLLLNVGYLTFITLFEVITNFSLHSRAMIVTRFFGIVLIICANLYFASRTKSKC